MSNPGFIDNDPALTRAEQEGPMDSPRTPLDPSIVARAMREQHAALMPGVAAPSAKVIDAMAVDLVRRIARLQSTDPSLSPDQEER